MKILVSTQLLSPYRADWLNELGKYADVDVLSLEKNNSERNEDWLNINMDRCHVEWMKGIRLPVFGKISFDFICKLKNNKYDVIILDGYGFVTQLLNCNFLNRKKIDYFVNVDGILPKDNKGILTKVKNHFLSKAPHFLCGSKVSNNQLYKYGIKSEQIVNHPFTSLYESDLFSNIADTEEKKGLREKLGITEEKVVLSVGRFSYMKGYGKGYDVLVRAAGQMSPDIGWYIVGDEPTEEFVKMKEDLKLNNLHYLGYKDKEALKEYYRAADIFVLMTVGDVWGLVINEAMACGLPVITTDKCIAGLELVKNDKNGYIVPVGDEKQLITHVRTLLDDADKLSEMGQNAIETIKDYTIENMAKVHMQVFEEV